MPSPQSCVACTRSSAERAFGTCEVGGGVPQPVPTSKAVVARPARARRMAPITMALGARPATTECPEYGHSGDPECQQIMTFLFPNLLNSRTSGLAGLLPS